MLISLDQATLLFGLIYYGLLFLVFTLRAYERKEEIYLKHIFSAQLIPFTVIFAGNLQDKQVNKAVTLIPLLFYLAYDLWYRVVTEKKPLHHPEKWPKGLIIYVILLYAGSIGLNWYGFLVSEQTGMTLVAGFFVMMTSYSLYQFRHNRVKAQTA